MCAPTACEYGCIEFVFMGNDNCPICRCDGKIRWGRASPAVLSIFPGFSTRELCSSDKDCETGGNCQNQLCRYPPIKENYSLACDFSYQCASDYECTNGKCRPTSTNQIHAAVACVFVYQCPPDFPVCAGMTCWKSTASFTSGPTNHVYGTVCVFDYQCPSGYRYLRSVGFFQHPCCSLLLQLSWDELHSNWRKPQLKSVRVGQSVSDWRTVYQSDLHTN
jgi:hypothetical protein